MSVRRIALLVVLTLGAGGGAAFAATLGVSSWHLWAGAQALTKSSCTVTGSAATTDTYVDESRPTSSFGGNTTATVRPNTGARRWLFVGFDISSCNIPSTGGADSATLDLRITSVTSTRTMNVTTVRSAWSGSLTWNAAQSLTYGSTFTTFSTSDTTPNVAVTADVDALIRNGSSSFGWRISDAGTGFATTTFATAENGTASYRPTLVIAYEK